MEHAILHETINGQQVNFYPETGFDDVMQTDGDDEITLRMVLEGMDAAIALLQNNLATKANAADVYTKSETYTKTEANNLLSNKADKATTLAGYGITNAYTKSDVYTKSEANTLLNNKANSNDLNNYLPLSGGVMSGGIAFNSVWNNTIKNNADDGFLQICGGSADTNGGSIFVIGKSHSQKGAVWLRANDGTNVSEIQLKADGTFTAGGKNVSCIDSSGTNWIRYTNGLQICWGNVLLSFSNSSSANNMITFGAPFKDSYYAINGGLGGGNQGYGFEVQFGHNSNTQCNVLAYRGTAITATNRELYYIAIGYWK